MTDQQNLSNKDIEESCTDYEFYAFGTAKIFEKRYQSIQNKTRIITFLGIINPLLIGSAALAFGIKWSFLPYFIYMAGIIGAAQLIFSTWSVVDKWDDKLSYSIESTISNTALYNSFKKIPRLGSTMQQRKFDESVREYEERERNDMKQSITEKEKRFANRSALIYYKKSCHLCKETPTTIKPSKCDSCGNF
ncbi:mobilome CxxCx(11)CxxC protein [Chromobacterium haemolyticum]|uniref:mobilome CxxCx(11)CxxC protein n=1 Tax=Chromobacterium haemolyticum TaxID=394935 RepID=UPI0009F00A4F|nr:mobilome CxxCx(11)CxxC protein [Chromobacterium haemolyticum]OQS32976.1 hypothetical protein B0T39_21580 [Chromobacterium haemolyticum]